METLQAAGVPAGVVQRSSDLLRDPQYAHRGFHHSLDHAAGGELEVLDAATTGEFDEWGNPENPEYYDYMLSYSPYDNVQPAAYPALLVTTGLHDSQVQYWEPAKWVARLRDQNTGSEQVLLHVNMDAGHGGQSGRFRRFRETAMEYAFLIALAASTT